MSLHRALPPILCAALALIWSRPAAADICNFETAQVAFDAGELTTLRDLSTLCAPGPDGDALDGDSEAALLRLVDAPQLQANQLPGDLGGYGLLAWDAWLLLHSVGLVREATGAFTADYRPGPRRRIARTERFAALASAFAAAAPESFLSRSAVGAALDAPLNASLTLPSLAVVDTAPATLRAWTVELAAALDRTRALRGPGAADESDAVEGALTSWLDGGNHASAALGLAGGLAQWLAQLHALAAMGFTADTALEQFAGDCALFGLTSEPELAAIDQALGAVARALEATLEAWARLDEIAAAQLDAAPGDGLSQLRALLAATDAAEHALAAVDRGLLRVTDPGYRFGEDRWEAAVASCAAPNSAGFLGLRRELASTTAAMVSRLANALGSGLRRQRGLAADLLIRYLAPTGGADSDGDGVNDVAEAHIGTDGNSVDSDGDGLDDGMELRWLHTDARHQRVGARLAPGDSDGDGVSDRDEWLVVFSDPFDADTDGDGTPDGVDLSPGIASWLHDGERFADWDDDGLGLGEELAPPRWPSRFDAAHAIRLGSVAAEARVETATGFRWQAAGDTFVASDQLGLRGFLLPELAQLVQVDSNAGAATLHLRVLDGAPPGLNLLGWDQRRFGLETDFAGVPRPRAELRAATDFFFSGAQLEAIVPGVLSSSAPGPLRDLEVEGAGYPLHELSLRLALDFPDYLAGLGLLGTTQHRRSGVGLRQGLVPLDRDTPFDGEGAPVPQLAAPDAWRGVLALQGTADASGVLALDIPLGLEALLEDGDGNLLSVRRSTTSLPLRAPGDAELRDLTLSFVPLAGGESLAAVVDDPARLPSHVAGIDGRGVAVNLQLPAEVMPLEPAQLTLGATRIARLLDAEQDLVAGNDRGRYRVVAEALNDLALAWSLPPDSVVGDRYAGALSLSGALVYPNGRRYDFSQQLLAYFEHAPVARLRYTPLDLDDPGDGTLTLRIRVENTGDALLILDVEDADGLSLAAGASDTLSLSVAAPDTEPAVIERTLALTAPFGALVEPPASGEVLQLTVVREDGVFALLADGDGDGSTAGSDPDDSDPSVHPGAPELRGDRVDNDGDGRIDEDDRLVPTTRKMGVYGVSSELPPGAAIELHDGTGTLVGSGRSLGEGYWYALVHGDDPDSATDEGAEAGERLDVVWTAGAAPRELLLIDGVPVFEDGARQRVEVRLPDASPVATLSVAGEALADQPLLIDASASHYDDGPGGRPLGFELRATHPDGRTVTLDAADGLVLRPAGAGTLNLQLTVFGEGCRCESSCRLQSGCRFGQQTQEIEVASPIAGLDFEHRQQGPEGRTLWLRSTLADGRLAFPPQRRWIVVPPGGAPEELSGDPAQLRLDSFGTVEVNLLVEGESYFETLTREVVVAPPDGELTVLAGRQRIPICPVGSALCEDPEAGRVDPQLTVRLDGLLGTPLGAGENVSWAWESDTLTLISGEDGSTIRAVATSASIALPAPPAGAVVPVEVRATATITGGGRPVPELLTGTVTLEAVLASLAGPGPIDGVEGEALQAPLTGLGLDVVPPLLLGLPAGARFDAGTGTLRWLPDFDAAGRYPVTVVESPLLRGTPTLFEIVIAPRNRAPSLDGPALLLIEEDLPFAAELSSGDSDSDALSAFFTTPAPPWLSLTEAAPNLWLLSGTPAAGTPRELRVEVAVVDREGAVARHAIELLVAGRNHAPAFETDRLFRATEGELLRLSLPVNDPDGDPLTVIAPALPEGARLLSTAQGPALWWRPDDAQVGLTVLPLVARDPSGLDAFAEIRILVAPVADPPRLAPVPDVLFPTGVLSELRFEAADPDSAQLFFSLTGAPPGLLLDETSGVLRWQPGSAEVGDYPLTITVSDGALEASADFTITVLRIVRDETPPFSEALPPGGTVRFPLDVTLSSSEPDATIVFTLDGSVPTGSSECYVAPIRLEEDSLLRFRAFDANGNIEAVREAEYRSSDPDGDGVDLPEDNCPLIPNPGQADGDADGSGDDCDPCPDDPGDDGDGDGVCNGPDEDNCPLHANADQADGDGDGLGDACDPCPSGPGPDLDNDGWCDDGDNCPSSQNPSQADRDGDGAGDLCDRCPDDPQNDIDDDDHCADADNCPDTANADQADSDNDGVGDLCDPCAGDPGNDADGDGICAALDLCPDVADTGDDADGDGRGDACDPCPLSALDDADQDGICADLDRCPEDFDPNQGDRDGDGGGDACDPCPDDANDDIDDDGRCADADNCPFTPNAAQLDTDGDGLGDPCDVCPGDGADDRDLDGHCADVDNCPAQPNPSQIDGDGDGRGDACDPCPGDPDDDADLDGRCADVDNCPELANGAQADADGDRQGDACDPCPADPEDDFDGDGLCGDVDRCPAVADAADPDLDGDGAGDACDPCPADPDNDADGDGRCADDDNCPALSNPNQADRDGDGLGDPCDPCIVDADNDADGDGLCGDEDNCPQWPNPSQLDSDGDGAGDRCDPCPGDFENDADGDGRCGAQDNCPAISNPDQRDRDADGLGDACDPCPDGGDPAVDDADGDGICDGADNCPAVANADQEDRDGDGGGDLCDPCPDEAEGDPDGDGVCAAVDNCPAFANPDQRDEDADGRGDLCDLCPFDPADDADGDGQCADVDLCPEDPAPEENDGDGDGLGDRCDLCPEDPNNDADQDGLCAGADNCPANGNPDQADADQDGLGDACDLCPGDTGNDVDNDLVCAAVDNCPGVANADQRDADGDGAGDACDVCPQLAGAEDSDGDGVCDPEDNCPDIADATQSDSDGDGRGDVCDSCPQDADDDADGDFLCGDVDNCPADANLDQLDRDNDGAGDVCDPCPLDADDDADGDGVCADQDLCPALADPEQSDGDGDGVGDACDPCPLDAGPDADDDGVCASADNCPSDANSAQGDADDDGLGDACDPCPADPGADADDDGICASDDNCPGVTNSDQGDEDGDGRGDACDDCPADPDDDVDGDGLCADVDNCPEVANADQADGDEDGRGDSCDRCPQDAAEDADGDGRCADADNCPEQPNADQLDGDGDGLGDACDPCPDDAMNDADGDGICHAVDTCPEDADPEQGDRDLDGLGDACDPCPLNPTPDADGDGRCGNDDNCPELPNADQLDLDGDGQGDVCDPCPRDADDDVDGDGLCADEDSCPFHPDPNPPDADGDGIGDVCDPCPLDMFNDQDGDRVCGDVDNCPRHANGTQQDRDGDGVGDVCDEAPLGPEVTPEPRSGGSSCAQSPAEASLPAVALALLLGLRRRRRRRPS